MSPRKLTEEDKQNILDLYRNSEATTSTLATSFGVSSSTISRFLKSSFAKSEYDELIQQKRLARTAKGEAKSSVSEKKVTKNKVQEIILPPKQLEIVTETDDSGALPSETASPNQLIINHTPLNLENENSDLKETPSKVVATSKPAPSLVNKKSVIEESFSEEEEDDDVDVAVLSEMLGEDLDDIEDEDDEDDDVWDLETDEVESYPHTIPGKATVQIRPLAEASLPRVCYLVIDRSAELIAKPLQDFADLGSIPQEEIEQKTLPVFDNHRVAKRFSHRREKVIKVPDSEVLKKTSRYLCAKGITRLLIEGQIYSVSRE